MKTDTKKILIDLFRKYCVGMVLGLTIPTFSMSIPDDFNVLLRWFNGEFDNTQQVLDPTSENPIQNHLHTWHRRISFPLLGDDVFYVHQTLTTESLIHNRKCVFHFSRDADPSAFRLRIYTLPLNQDFGYQFDPPWLSSLFPPDLILETEQDITIRKKGNCFVGEIKTSTGSTPVKRFTLSEKTCTFFGQGFFLKNIAVDDTFSYRCRRSIHLEGNYRITDEKKIEKQFPFRICIGEVLQCKWGVDPNERFTLKLLCMDNSESSNPDFELIIHRDDETRRFRFQGSKNSSFVVQIPFLTIEFQLEQSDLRTLISYMSGSFSSHEQSIQDTAFSDIRMDMTPIWPDQREGRWIYVEQSEAQADKPYRQRIYRLRVLADGSIESATLSIPHPFRFSNKERSLEPLSSLSPDSLQEREGCAVILWRQPDGSFYGKTRERSCLSQIRGASYALSEVSISAANIQTWDRGFDDQGRQVWGSSKGPYAFQKTGWLPEPPDVSNKPIALKERGSF